MFAVHIMGPVFVGVRLDVECLGVRTASHGAPEGPDPEPLAVCAVIVPAAPESRRTGT